MSERAKRRFCILKRFYIQTQEKWIDIVAETMSFDILSGKGMTTFW